MNTSRQDGAVAAAHRAPLLWLCGASALAVFAVPAMAQETPASANPAPDQTADIVVTATKRPESALSVPLSLSVFSGETLAKQGATTIADISHSVPSLYLQERGNLSNAFTIRGVGGDPRNIGIESGVSVSIDGVTAGRTSGYNLSLLQIAQLEVLRGPQGTLFGTNTVGGVINITTQKPTADTHGSAQIEYGNYNALRMSASLSGGLSDTVFAGFTLQRTTRDGLIHNTVLDNDLDNQNRIGGRGQLRWVPNDNLEVYLTGDVTHDNSRAVLSQLLPPYTGYAATNPPANRFVAAMDQRNTDDLNVAGGSATINYSTGGYTLTSISAYRDVNETVFSDGDNAAADIIHSGPFTDHSRFATQELRLVSPSDKPFRYVAGLFYQNEIATSHRDIYLGGSLAGGAVTDARIVSDTYAAYANANLDLGSKVTLTGGLRYNIEDKDGSYSQVRQTVPALTFNFPDLSRTDRALSWTASARYKPTDNVSIYGTVSRGFKSGGFNVDLASDVRTTPALLTFAPEKLTNYEAGVKARLFNRRLQLSASVFHLDYTNRQVSQFVGSGGALPSVYVTNAGASKTDGGEVEATLYLPHDFTLNASYSHLRARYTSFPNATAAGASYSGNVTELTPDNTLSIVADQRIQLGSGAITYNAAARYTGKTYFDAANVASNTQDGFWLFDARLGYIFAIGSAKKELEVYFWGKNLSNKDYLVFRRQYNGANQGLYGDPRTYGAGARLKF